MDRPGFCILPFTTLYCENNRVRLCCESEERTEINLSKDVGIADVWNNDFYKDIRQQMLDGKLPKACKICRLNEEVGEESKRQWENKNYTKLIEDIQNYQSVVVDSPVNFDVRPSNKCNLECVMCDGVVSTAIIKRVDEYKQRNNLEDFVISSGVDWQENHYIINHVKQNSDKIRMMKFCGGEPFLTKEVVDIIEYLVESGNAPNIRLAFITNGTVVRSRWFSEMLVHFEDVKLNVSVDGIGSVAEYVRYPTKWSVVDKNLQLFKKLETEHSNIRLSLAPVIHLLNALHIHEVIEYAAVNDVNVALSPVYQASDEQHLDVSLLTDELRQTAYQRVQQVLDKHPDISFNLGRGFVDHLIEMEQDTDPDKIDKLRQVVRYWDDHKKIKFKDQYEYLNYLLDK